jgi:hypothetical protein
MKTRLAVAAGMLLTLTTAASGSLLRGAQEVQSDPRQPSLQAPPMAAEATPEPVAVWKASASTADYVPYKLPI